MVLVVVLFLVRLVVLLEFVLPPPNSNIMDADESPDPREDISGEEDILDYEGGDPRLGRKMSTSYQKIDGPAVPDHQLPLFRVWEGERERGREGERERGREGERERGREGERERGREGERERGREGERERGREGERERGREGERERGREGEGRGGEGGGRGDWN